ncbi:hypothetical protein QJQ45_007362 [Haematococcus lacustris]|nr:hypothetical protein QJQ45_007362 [Haematococcus lacustris]
MADNPEEPPELTPTGYARGRGTLLPPLWQRLQEQITGGKPDLQYSGANVTLADLLRHDEPSEMSLDFLEQDPEDVPPMSGWLGTPDPRKYAPGTTALSRKELDEEVAAGNVVALSDWGEELDGLEPWQAKLVLAALAADWQQNRMFFELHDRDGQSMGKISYWDLYHYVYDNPELEALARSSRSVGGMEGEEGEGGEGVPAHMMPFQGSPDDPYRMQLSTDMTQQLPWNLVASAPLWLRPPTRWLKGAGASPGAEMAVYVHEGRAHEELGPRWAGEDPRLVLGGEEYWREVLEAGPRMGMTYALAAAKDLPLQEVSETWGSQLVDRLQQQGSLEEATSSLADLDAVFNAPRLAAETRLLDPLGLSLRKGSVLWLTTYPGGRVLMQAMTGDPVREREYYCLGWLEDAPEVCDALRSLFLGGGPDAPEELPLEPSMPLQAASHILMAANGYVAGNRANHPDVSTPEKVMPIIGLNPGDRVSFRITSRDEGAPQCLLRGIQEQRVDADLLQVFAAAASAADQVLEDLPDDADMQHVIELRKAAAQKALAAGLSALCTAPDGSPMFPEESLPDLFAASEAIMAK